jgi:hypothetical protein
MNGNYILCAMSHNKIQQILQIVVYLCLNDCKLDISNKTILLIVIGEIG